MSASNAALKSDLLAGLTDAQAQRFLSLGRDRKLKAGDTIFKLGSEAEELFVIGAGRVDLTFPLVVMGETKEVRFQSLDAPRALAWSALVPPHRLTMSAKAATECELIAFGRDAVKKLFAQDPAIGLAVMTNLAGIVGARLLETQALWVREVQRNVSQTYR